MPAFALNHMTVARMGFADLLDAAQALGCVGVEVRNDLPRPLFDGIAPSEAGAMARDRGLRLLAVAEVKRFNDWSDVKAGEALALVRLAHAAGAEAVALIPRNDNGGMGNGERQASLRVALKALLPMLEDHDLIGLVEPLGFPTCALRHKAEAVEAIEALGCAGRVRIVHDTFHHHLAGDGPLAPGQTGIVHVSGVVDPAPTDGRDDRRAPRPRRWARPAWQPRPASGAGGGRLARADQLRGVFAPGARRARPRRGPARQHGLHPRGAGPHGGLTRGRGRPGEGGRPAKDHERRAGRRQENPLGGRPMTKTLIIAGVAALMSTAASAETIGVSMARFDDNFLTVLRNGMTDYAGTLDGVEVQVEDAGDDVAKQLDQINNFIANGVDAIVVNAVDTSATQAMSDAAAAAGVPLVYVNREPINVDTLPDNQAFVASNEVDSGTLETLEVCRLLAAAGMTEANVYIMMGQLSNQAAVQRTADIHDVMASGDCGVTLNIIDEQTANWSRDEAQDLMTNWLSTGAEFDAVIANNDEMALGAIQSMKAAGMAMTDVIVGGVDATQDALAAMQAGDLDATVFQDAAGQGSGALDAALSLVRGEAVDQKVYIPFQLVTPDNIADYMSAN